ncbi:MAG: ABC transporter permease [Hyphomicrobiales bacterium]|nr:ABC transporter permease [Hyphomicrobiales bacterium]
MSVLRVKLVRDLLRLWPQVLAIVAVMAAGSATLILGVGAYATLAETRAAYYERNRFADVFAEVTRAPKALGEEIARIPGVAAVEMRIAKLAVLDLPDLPEPASAMLVSLPDRREATVDRLHMIRGRSPMAEDEREVVVSQPFADANRFDVGSRFAALIDGRRRELTIVGVALSPEFVYAIGPGDIMPDDRRFGVVWMSEHALAGAYDLVGAFSSVHLRLMRGASEAEAIARLDDLLARWGGRGAYGRRDQTSHAFLDAELKQLEAMSRILPPIFLAVAAFLVNMTLARTIALEREQIGLMKALGRGDLEIGRHYLEFVAVVAIGGAGLGIAVGTWLGDGMARLYGDFFHFPFLVFRRSPETWAIAAGVTLLSAFAGAAQTVARVARLPPAEAMRPPAPTRYRHGLVDRLARRLGLRQTLVMVIRHVAHAPLRSLGSILGIALSVAVLVGSLWVYGSMDLMLDVTFQRADRQDATLGFVRERPLAALGEVGALPGVTVVEPFRSIPAKIRNGRTERRIAISARAAGADLSRVLDRDFRPVELPKEGIALSDALARILGVGVGDTVEIELSERNRRVAKATVTAIITTYLGLGAYMDLDAAGRLLREGTALDGVTIAYDPVREADLFAVLKTTPVAAFVALQKRAMRIYRDTLEQNLLVMITVYVTLGMIVAFGVVYNFARISLSEQGRELASLRVLGLTRGEVSGILFAELAILTLAAQPIGWLLGAGLAHGMAAGLENELYRVPVVILADVPATASGVTILAALISALVVRRRIDHLDLVEVLKTRE